MIYKTQILLLAVVTGLFLTGFHPIHVSITEMEYDEEVKSLEISQRIFLDDLEKQLSDFLKIDRLDINSLNRSELNEYLFTYMAEYLELEIEDKKGELSWVGYEIDRDVIFIYVEVKDLNDFTKIKISNRILLETYRDQVNLVHLQIGDLKKSLRFDRTNQKDELIFNK